jgi:hypothetical protein
MNADIFSGIDWGSVTREKADFIYREALEYQRGIIESIDYITEKAHGLLAITMPIMAALVGFLAISENIPLPLLITSICACSCFLVIIILLLRILLPQSIYQGPGSPSAYFSEEYYKKKMKKILIGNIQDLHKTISYNSKILDKRGRLFKLTIIFYAILPIVSLLVYLFSNFLVSLQCK